MSRAIGIDLGTSNSVACIVLDDEAIVIADAAGVAIQPSVVSFMPDGRSVVGPRAKERMSSMPANTVYSAKRLIGRPYRSPEVRKASESYAYEIHEGEDGNPRIVVAGQTFTIEQLQAIVLRHMKSIAEAYLGEPVSQAVITVPANFNDNQRRATQVAAQLAGLETLRILNEPTAAALAYGYEQGKRERIAIYDFGGGTFDITILDLRDNVFEVLSTAGDTFLGGDDFDHQIASMIVEQFRQETNVDISKNRNVMQRMKAIAENLKIQLATSDLASVEITENIPATGKPYTMEYRLSRDDFRGSCMGIVQRSFLVCDEALKLAGLTSAEVDRLVLVGGTTRSPLVREMVEQYFFKQPLTDINPDEVVAVGAALYAHGLEAQAQSAGFFEGNAKPKDSRLEPDSLIEMELELEDVVTAPPLLIDVTPQALGIETVGGFMDTLLPRNSTVPCEQTRRFATSSDNQDMVRINIYEGDGKRSSDNRLLGELLLHGLPPGLRGDVSVEVTFSVNTDGVLEVKARDSGTGQVQQCALSVAGGVDHALEHGGHANLPEAWQPPDASQAGPPPTPH